MSLERNLRKILKRAGAEIIAIGERSFDDVFAAADPAGAMRAEVERRSEEVKRVLDRVTFTIQCRYGARAAEKVRRGLEYMHAQLHAAILATLELNDG